MVVEKDYLRQYEIAEKLVSEGRYEDAIEHYQTAIEMNPEFRDAYISLANLYMKMGKVRRVKAVVRRMLHTIEDEETLYLSSVLLYQIGDFKGSKKLIEKAMKENNTPDYWIVLGNVYFGMEEYDKAEECYNEALRIDPMNEEAWNNKGFLYFTQSKFDMALNCYEKAIEINPSYRQAWYNKGYTYHAMGNLSKAIYNYWMALRIDSQDEVAWNNMGNALYNLGKYMESIPYFMKSVKINPNYEIAWNNIGNALDRMGMHEFSIPFHEKALSINPKFDYAWHAKGHALCELGKYEESLEFLERAIELNPDYGETWYWRGVALYRLERYEEAIESLKRAVEIDKDLILAWELIGDIYFLLGYYVEGWRYYEEALKIGESKDKARIYLKIGKYKEALNHVDDATKAYVLLKLGKYEDILKIESRDEEVIYVKCLALEALGRFEDALNEIKEMKGDKFENERRFLNYLLGKENIDLLSEWDAEYIMRIGTLLLENKEYEKAIEIFSQIKTKESYYFLGEANISIGNQKKGIKYLEISAGMGFELAIEKLKEVKSGEKASS